MQQIDDEVLPGMTFHLGWGACARTTAVIISRAL
jgi:hypothetical protein